MSGRSPEGGLPDWVVAVLILIFLAGAAFVLYF